MPDPITIALVIAAAGVLFGSLLLWHHIVDFFAAHVIPSLRRSVGDAVADTVATVIAWLDGKAVLTRKAVISAWRVFKERVLGIKAVYRKTSATTATVETVSTLRTGPQGATKVTVKEESVSLDELPDEIREQLIRSSGSAVAADLGADVERMAANRAEKEGIQAQELQLSLYREAVRGTSFGGGLVLTTQIITAAAVVAGAYMLYTWFRLAGEQSESVFHKNVLDDAARWMAPHVGAEKGAIRAALGELVDHRTPDAILKRLKRLECEVTKLNPSTARRTVVVLLESGDGHDLVGRIAQEMGWDDLPEAVRADFIRLGGDTHAFQIISQVSTAGPSRGVSE